MNSRRKFIKRAMASTAFMGAYATLGMQLGAAKAFASQSRFTDHKALVCVFLYGGNDSYNMLVPTDASMYQAYQQTRQNIAVAQSDLLDLTISSSNIGPHGMPSSMSSVVDMYNSGDLSIISNMGPLLEPVTKNQLLSNPGLIPPQLFSHNSQQALWQTAGVNAQLNSGWLGRISDLLQDTNTSLPMSFGVNSADILNTGTQVSPLVVDASGVEEFALLNTQDNAGQLRLDAHQRMINLANRAFTREYANRILTTQSNNEILSTALAGVPARNTLYPEDNSLGSQLKMVADLIATQQTLGQSRQVFFVGIGGWDTHDNQADQHPILLATLANALAAFNQDLKALGKHNDVTTVTLSEFGRTLTSNNDGTDHGWAGHQMIMGGAVNGGQIHGHLPDQVLNSEDDLDDGRIIPTTSIEQLGVSLTRWFGLSESEIAEVFPNMGRFDHSALSLFA